MGDIKFDDFWEYLLHETGNNDSWWLRGWLEDTLSEYGQTTPCSNCGSRARSTENIWSETHNHILERRLLCDKCKQIISVKDERAQLRKELSDGNIKQRDIPVLSKELK